MVLQAAVVIESRVWLRTNHDPKPHTSPVQPGHHPRKDLPPPTSPTQEPNESRKHEFRDIVDFNIDVPYPLHLGYVLRFGDNVLTGNDAE